jgi:hypothetical protein
MQLACKSTLHIWAPGHEVGETVLQRHPNHLSVLSFSPIVEKLIQALYHTIPAKPLYYPAPITIDELSEQPATGRTKMSQQGSVVSLELHPESLIERQAMVGNPPQTQECIASQHRLTIVDPTSDESFEKSMTSGQPKLSQDHSAEEWEVHRELFTRYYIIEDKPLPEVKVIMEYQHGFKATYVLAMFPNYRLDNRRFSDRQYKRKIAAWKLEKNIKDADMKVMLRKQLKRKVEEGKESEFFVNGRPVPPQKMNRFVQRKSFTKDKILEEIGMSFPGTLFLLALTDASRNPAIYYL